MKKGTFVGFGSFFGILLFLLILSDFAVPQKSASISLFEPLPEPVEPADVSTPTNTTTLPAEAPSVAKFTTKERGDPLITEVYLEQKWIATFTHGSYTVIMSGPERVFSEPTTDNYVRSSIWVRTLPAPFTGIIDEVWLENQLRSTKPDVLAIAMEYVTFAKNDAAYGPLATNSSSIRLENADFNDYLGISWNYSGWTDEPDPTRLNAVDCSGYMRLVWGYRIGLPLAHKPNGTALPKKSYDMYRSGLGNLLVDDAGVQVTSFSILQPGDLVFFDSSEDDGKMIDHVGIYIGKDNKGHFRFVSSRKKINGPTIGDIGGAAILDGNGFYAKRFRAIRRL